MVIYQDDDDEDDDADDDVDHYQKEILMVPSTDSLNIYNSTQ